MKNHNNRGVSERLLSAWPEIEPRLRKCTVLLFLDYDGTLTPIVDDPLAARLSLKTKKLLRDLSFAEGIKTAIVSGRSLADLKARVGVPGLLYAGNHGLEFEGPSVRFVHPEAASAKNLIRKITIHLKKVFKPFPGILVENKIFTLSVHYRKLAPEKVDPLKALFLKTLGPDFDSSKVVLKEGKKVWEIRPAIRWNKGTLVLWLLARLLARSPGKVLPIYVGDDQTDEDAFRVIQRKGLGVKVMEGKRETTEALYYVRSPKEVFDFLKRLMEVKRKEF